MSEFEKLVLSNLKNSNDIWDAGFKEGYESGRLHERAIWAAKAIDAPPACLNNLMRKEQKTCKTCEHVDCPHHESS